MAEKISEFYEKIKNKKIAIVGAGISNTPLIEMLHQKGAIVDVRDRQEVSKKQELCKLLDSLGIHYVFGPNYLENLQADYIIRSPGIRFDLPQFVKAVEQGAVLTSEMELFFELCPCKIIGVTGSDGKSTTTTLTYEFLKAQGYRCHVGGNLGKPLLPDIEQICENDFAVVELSSFQLHRMNRSPDVAVITNISPNHLDYHKDYNEYIEAKENIYLHQNQDGLLLLNADNDVTRNFRQKGKGKVVLFSRKESVENGTYYADKTVWLSAAGKTEKVIDRSELLLPGDYNVENFMAAYLAVREFVSLEAVKKVANSFGGVPHRMELVRKLDGVTYYNNSIASSPSRVHVTFKTFEEKMIIIAGGSDKKIPFDEFGVEINKHVKLLLLTGATVPKIYKAVVSAENYNPGNIKIIICSSIFEALHIARKEAKPGDNVILNPACPSFDRFRNFEERGDLFREAVKKL